MKVLSEIESGEFEDFSLELNRSEMRTLLNLCAAGVRHLDADGAPSKRATNMCTRLHTAVEDCNVITKETK